METSATVNAIIFTITAGIIWWQAHLARKQLKSNHDWWRRKAAHDLIFEISKGEFKSLRRKMENEIDIWDDEQTYSDVKTRLSEDDIYRLEKILNILENVCISIKDRVVDKEIIVDSIGLLTIRYYKWSKEYIDEQRSIHDQLLWIELDEFVGEWEERIDSRQTPEVRTGRDNLPKV